MSSTIRISLDNLECIAEDDGFGASEPYIWVWALATGTKNGSVKLVIYNQPLHNARVVIRDGMRANETTPIPAFVGQLAIKTDLNPSEIEKIILITVLLEEDLSKDIAMQRGLETFNNVIGAQIINNEQALTEAQNNPDPEVLKALTSDISDAVAARIKAAILSAETKIKDHDDSIGTAFKLFSSTKNVAGQVTPIQSQAFSLSFTTTKKIQPAPPSPVVVIVNNNFKINGKIEIQSTQTNLCQAQSNSVAAAQSNLNSIHQKIQALQNQLRTASPVNKPKIMVEIEKIESLTLPKAELTLEKARINLQKCRTQFSNPGGVNSLPGGTLSA